ncbi:hypothetical protein ACQKL5_10845 [Peribacillus sp. NPDC097675]|uniref:hypothetical protein n=1 Tax=Peribacillus sp. NPDC097675 TaxID=3390618 RepID=UPI003D06EBF4
MDSAFLHDTVFNIEKKRIKLEKQKLNRNEIKCWFEENYRNFSKKGAFTCIRCNKTVNMNLTKDEGRPFYFRHNDDSECSYSKNTRTYEKHISKHEVKSKKDIGLTVFREILEGQLKPHGAKIERGFHYKKELSFIPDFIISFPSSENFWAIDYYTAIGQGLVSGSYARHLQNRKKSYEKEGFKTFSFVDSSWLSFDEDTNKGTLLSAETHVTNKNEEDALWDRYLKEKLHAELFFYFIKETGASSLEFNTQHIIYVNISNRLCTIFRFIETSYNSRNMTFYRFSSSKISLEQALTLDTFHEQFVFLNISEELTRKSFLHNLIEKKKQMELEIQQKEELLKQKQRAIELEDVHIEKEMNERARIATLRPIEVNPNRFYRKHDFYSSSYYNHKNSGSSFESMNDQNEKQKKQLVKERLLSQPIKGELYIDGDKKYWRLIVLKWINENQAANLINVSLHQLLDYMKKSGVSFNQQDNIVQYPIINFLKYYEKIIKTELKKKVLLMIKD